MVDRFDPTTGIWSPVGDLKVVPAGGVLTVVGRDLHTATLLADGRVLVAGGEGNVNYTTFTVFRTAELFDPQTNTWTFTGRMHVGRAQSAAVSLADGTVLMVGGAPKKKLVTATCEIFTPPGTASRPRTAAAPPRFVARQRALAPQAFSVQQPANHARFVRRPASAGKWTVTGSMNVPRGGANGFPAILLPGGKVLVEGCDNALGVAGRTAELFDPGTGKWTMTGSMHVARCNHGAALLPDGRVLVAGGDSGGIVHATAEVYNPKTGKWSAAVHLNSTRFLFSLLQTASGAVIAPAGAAYNTIPRDSADFYDMASGRWIATPSLNVSRYEYGAAALSDGKVLVFGGFTQNATWTFYDRALRSDREYVVAAGRAERAGRPRRHAGRRRRARDDPLATLQRIVRELDADQFRYAEAAHRRHDDPADQRQGARGRRLYAVRLRRRQHRASGTLRPGERDLGARRAPAPTSLESGRRAARGRPRARRGRTRGLHRDRERGALQTGKIATSPSATRELGVLGRLLPVDAVLTPHEAMVDQRPP